MSNHGIAWRTKQQITAFNKDAGICAQGARGQKRVKRYLKRLLELSGDRAGRGRVFEIVDTNGGDPRTVTSNSDVIGLTRDRGSAQCSRRQWRIEILGQRAESVECIVHGKID